MVGPRESHVTLLLSTFDGARWLPDLLESLRAQTHENWTLLIRDDGSHDETVAIVESAAIHDARIRLLVDDAGNLGPTASFLSLLAEVNDGFFAFCDQDDRWYPDKLAASLAALTERVGPTEVGAVYTDARVVDGEGAVLHTSALAQRGARGAIPYGQLLVNNVAIGATLLGTAELARRAVAAADGLDVLWHDWWVALVAGYAGTLLEYPEVTMDWRRHGGTVTGGRPDGVGGRAARRRRYLAFSIAAADRLAGSGPGPDEAANAAVAELARVDPTRPSVRSLLRAWRRGGVRAWPARGQVSLLFSAAMGRMNQ